MEKRNWKRANVGLLICAAVCLICYDTFGGLWLKGVTSSWFVILGGVNLWAARKLAWKQLRFFVLMEAGLFCGGITTLEDKSCGCVQKGGSAPIMDVIGYGDAVTTKGLNMLYGPGNDLVSATALTAAGAHMVLFTTGRGTPFGAPAPTMKIATNTPLATKKSGWIDFNAGVVADGQRTLDEAGADLLALVLEVASGKQTRTEQKGYREISIFKDGVVL